MKATGWAAGLVLIFGLSACGGSDTADLPAMPEVVGQQLDDAQSQIKDAGFEDDVTVNGGGMFGIIDESNWKVCEQTPAAGKPFGDTPTLTVDRSCGDDTSEPTTASTTAPTTAPTTVADKPSEPPTTEVKTEGNLTAENSADLAALLIGPECDDTIETFASMYSGRTIEFDGNIADYAPEMQTDMLIYSGDYSETSSNGGPAFKFTPPNIPDNVSQGDNVHIVAQVGEFNRIQCLFFLDPVSTEVR